MKALTGWDRLVGHNDDVTAEKVSIAERLLAGQVTVFTGRDLDRVIAGIGDRVNPDGIWQQPEARQAVRSLTLAEVRRGTYAGMWDLQGRLTPEVAVQLRTVLDPLARPRHLADTGGRVIEADTRSAEMRRHDGLGELVERALRAGDQPAQGGVPATLIVTTTDRELRTGRGVGVCDDGTPMSMDRVFGLTGEAEVAHAIFAEETDQPLRLGRTERIASRSQTLMLHARDRGCTFPACDRPPKWCQRHHRVAWQDGGPTDVDNLMLLCAFHHHRFQQRGWTAEMRGGRVWWTPPASVDPNRRPLINSCHQDPPAGLDSG